MVEHQAVLSRSFWCCEVCELLLVHLVQCYRWKNKGFFPKNFCKRLSWYSVYFIKMADLANWSVISVLLSPKKRVRKRLKIKKVTPIGAHTCLTSSSDTSFHYLFFDCAQQRFYLLCSLNFSVTSFSSCVLFLYSERDDRRILIITFITV